MDFDGTIADIAPTPDEARVRPGCANALKSLSRKLAAVSVISGRSAEELQSKVGLEGVTYAGNHGAELIEDGRLTPAPRAADSQAELHALLEHLRANADGPGLIWQDKGFSASVHYRLSPDPDRAMRSLAAALASSPPLDRIEAFWGKRVLELRPAAGLDKGYAVRSLAERRRLDGLIFAGDDVTDIDGMRSVESLRAETDLCGLAIAVLHDDSPQELLESADYAVDGVQGVEVFLKWLNSAAG